MNSFAAEIAEFKAAKASVEQQPSKREIKAMFDILFRISLGLQKFVEEGKITRSDEQKILDDIRNLH